MAKNGTSPYVVVRQLLSNGDRYEPGDTVELTSDDATPLLNRRIIAVPPPPAPTKPKAAPAK